MMLEELVPLTPEAEKEHERFLERCRRSLYIFNMKEEVREKIAKWFVDNLRFDYAVARLAADQILAIEGEGWRIAVVEKVSPLPESPYQSVGGQVNMGYVYARQDMRSSGWVKEAKDEREDS